MNLKPILIIAGTIVIMAAVLTGSGGSLLTASLSFVLVFVLPGYALVKALFPGSQLEAAEVIALTLGLSLAIVSLGGMALHWLPWKLETRSWTILIGSFTILAALIALLRGLSVGQQSGSTSRVKLRFSFREGIFFVLAVVGIACAFWLAIRGEVIQNKSNFTQFWIQAEEGGGESYSVGINNHENQSIQYRLVITRRGEIEAEYPLIDLEPDESWTESFPMPEGDEALIARIYRLYADPESCAEESISDLCLQNEEIYREVILWGQID